MLDDSAVEEEIRYKCTYLGPRVIFLIPLTANMLHTKRSFQHVCEMKVDIWSLGCTFIEKVTVIHPWYPYAFNSCYTFFYFLGSAISFLVVKVTITNGFLF